MNRVTAVLLGVLALGGGQVAAQAAPAQPAADAPKPIEVGAVAPDFEIPGATRYGVLAQPIKLSDFKGKTVVMAFFPKARTKGCTIQMHAYTDQYSELFKDGRNVVLIALSADPADVLASWAKDDQFQFLMGSDKELSVAKAYGAVGRPGMTNRNLFVVGPDGRIAYRATPFREVDPVSYTDLGDAITKLTPSTD